MHSLKQDFLRTLDEIVAKPIFVTDSVDELGAEIDANCWWIGGSKEQIQSLSRDEWLSFMRTLISRRADKLRRSELDVGLRFYSWHDWQAGQLRFNLINNNHRRLPFGNGYELVPLEEIIDSFLSDEFFGIVPSEKLQLMSDNGRENPGENSAEGGEYVTKVYEEVIVK